MVHARLALEVVNSQFERRHRYDSRIVDVQVGRASTLE